MYCEFVDYYFGYYCYLYALRMKIFCIIQFLLASLFYSIHFYFSRFIPEYEGTFCRFYLGDFLALPVVVPILINVPIKLGYSRRKYVHFHEIVLLGIIFSLVFEWLSPCMLYRGTSDVYDVLAYFVGGFLLYFSQYLTEKERPHV